MSDEQAGLPQRRIPYREIECDGDHLTAVILEGEDVAVTLPDTANIQAQIGGAVRAARLQTGTKQEELAVAIGLDRTTLSRYEAGTRSIPIEVLLQIAYVLRMPLSELVPGAREMEAAWAPQPPPQQPQVLEIIGKALMQRPDITPQVLELITLLTEHDPTLKELHDG